MFRLARLSVQLLQTGNPEACRCAAMRLCCGVLHGMGQSEDCAVFWGFRCFRSEVGTEGMKWRRPEPGELQENIH